VFRSSAVALGLLLVLLWLGNPAIAEEAERFENPTAGISLLKPVGWNTASLQDVEENRGRVRLPDAELQKAIQKHATAPLFVFMKHPEPHDDLNPSVQVILRPLGPLAGGSPVQIMEAAVGPLQQMFTDFEFVQAIHETTVSGLPAAHMTATYSILNAEGSEFPTLSRMWIVPRGSFMFLIGMSGPQEGPDVSESEFTAVLDSVEILE